MKPEKPLLKKNKLLSDKRDRLKSKENKIDI